MDRDNITRTGAKDPWGREATDLLSKRHAEAWTNVFTRHGDGFEGWPEKAPFDRIIATAAFRKLPESLTEQLINTGIFITPLGYETISQRLWKIIRIKEGLAREELLPVVFVPIIKGVPHGGKSADNDDEHS